MQAYSATSTYAWTPGAADVGDHAVRVSVRNAGSLLDFEDTQTMPYTVSGGSGMLVNPAGRILLALRRMVHRTPPPVSLAAGFQLVVHPTSGATVSRYSLYTPELNLMAETETTTASAPALAYEYIWFAGQPVAQVDTTTSTTHWTFTDHLGTPILQTDVCGAVDWRAEYEPFGSIFSLRTGSTRHQPLRLPGQESENISPDRSYNIFRWYRAGWGRYTQADPVGIGGRGIDLRGRWQNYSHSSTASGSAFELLERRHAKALYDYAEGNPVSNTDRVGLKPYKCSLVTMVSKDGPGPYRRCLMIGSCRDYFDWWDVAVTSGMIVVPSCFQCPKRCIAVERGGGLLWFDPHPTDWYCTPWTPIVGFGSGPTGADPF